jgi:hypothetical protein
MDPQFAPALSRLQRLLSAASRELSRPINHALIGGLSLAAWGVVRATQDIDFLADSEPSPISDLNFRNRLKNYLERQRCRIEWRIGDPDDPVPLLLRILLPRSYGGLGSDVLWAHKRWHREALARSITVNLSRRRVQILHPEDLILLKLDAGGPQDLADVNALLTDPPNQLNVARLKQTAGRVRLDRLLEKCLRAVTSKK